MTGMETAPPALDGPDAALEAAAEAALLGVEAPAAPRVALLCCPDSPCGGPDARALAAACARAGVSMEAAVWSDPAVRWLQYDAIVPLFAFDWSYRPSSFRSWLADREREEAIFFNSLALVRWGLDKACLLDLQDLGVPMPEMVLRPAGARTPGRWPDGAALVAKPRVGAGGQGLELISAAEWRPPPKDVIVQAYQPSVAARGEVSAVCVDGTVCAQARRTPAEMDFRAQEHWGAAAAAEPLDGGLCAAAERVLGLLPQTPLYARLDFWEGGGGEWQLADVELLEPDLFIGDHPQVAERIAEALARRLSPGPPAAELG